MLMLSSLSRCGFAMRGMSGCAPDCALTFFASPKKVSKERRAQDKAATRFLALLGPALKGVGDKDKLQYHYQTPAHAPKAAPWRAFGGSAVGIPLLPRRYEEASSADGGGSGAQVFERSEFLRTPPPSSNAAYRRSRATNPARLFFGDFLLATQKKVTALSGANPDLQRIQSTRCVEWQEK